MLQSLLSPTTENPPPRIPQREGALSDLWERFDADAEKHVQEMVESLNSQLDNLLLFAALFSAINTAFLVFTLPMLSPSSQDETNALLILLVEGLRNNTLASSATPTAAEFTPLKYTRAVNTLFSASLTFSIIASFGAVIGKQWLTYYSRNPNKNPEERRRELQRKIIGAHSWHLRALLEVGLTTVIQIALLLFTVGLILFLQSIDETVGIVNSLISGIGLTALSLTVLCALYDPCCPFQSPITASILPNTGRLVVWGTLAGGLWIITFPVVVYNIIQAIGYAFQRRMTRSRAKWLGAVSQMRAAFLRTPKYRPRIDDVYQYLFQRWRGGPSDAHIEAYSAGWMISEATELNSFLADAQAVCDIKDRQLLDWLADEKAMLRFHNPAKHHRKVTAPQVQLVTETWLHIYLGTLDAEDWWLEESSVILKRCRPSIGAEMKEAMGSVTVPAVAYVAAGIRFLLDKRVYWMWRKNPTWKGNDSMNDTDAMVRNGIASCISSTSPPRIVSLVALAVTEPWGHKFRHPKPGEVRNTQREIYTRLWETYVSDEHIVDNLADAAFTYVEHWRTATTEEAWCNEPQFLSLLLAAKPYIASEVSESQALGHGEHFVEGMSALVRELHQLPDQPQYTRMLDAAMALLTSVVQRFIDLGKPSTEMLAVQVQSLCVLALLYKDHQDGAILTSIHQLLDHCHSHLHLRPSAEKPEVSRQASSVVSATGSVLEGMGSDHDAYRPFVLKVADFIEELAEKSAVDWTDEHTSSTWASNATTVAMLHYIQQLLRKSSTYHISEQHFTFTTHYTRHVVQRQNQRWTTLTDERIRKELSQALEELERLFHHDDNSPQDEKDLKYALETLQ